MQAVIALKKGRVHKDASFLRYVISPKSQCLNSMHEEIQVRISCGLQKHERRILLRYRSDSRFCPYPYCGHYLAYAMT